MNRHVPKWAQILVLTALLAITGCLESETSTCADGRICPAKLVCFTASSDEGSQCVEPDSVAACTGKENRDACDVPAGGRCQDGLCVLSACGNCVLEGDEVCDDGNNQSGDGCRSDCLAASWQLGRTEQPRLVGTGAATGTNLDSPNAIAVDILGNLFIADPEANRILKVSAAGITSTVAGTGVAGEAGDGGLATNAQLQLPAGIAVDGIGNLFIADSANHRIRKVNRAGIITTVAGTGVSGFGGDDGPASEAQLNGPKGIAVDGLGNLFFADRSNNRIRKVNSAGIISTLAGNGVRGYGGDGGLAGAAQLDRPADVALDGLGNLFIADTINHRVRKVDAAGIISTVAGTGTQGLSGDGGPATAARLHNPEGLTVDGLGNLFIADRNNHRIRKVDSAGTITTVVGTESGFSGDGGLATAARLSSPFGVALDARGYLFIADKSNKRIRMVDTAGIITSVVQVLAAGDGGLAISSTLGPAGLAVDSLGNLLLADPLNHRIRKVNSEGIISTVVGTGVRGGAGDDGPAIEAQLADPVALALDSLGNLFIAELGANRIRKVDSAGIITTVVGTGQPGLFGDGGPAIAARLSLPADIALDSLGNLYIADSGNKRIRKVDAAGIITTVAGTVRQGDAATSFGPFGVAVDSLDNLFIADDFNDEIHKVDTQGTITTVAGTSRGFSGDDGPAIAAQLHAPQALAFDSFDNLFIADRGNRRIRKIDSQGRITTVMGTGAPGGSGDGGPAIEAELQSPSRVALGADGSLFVVDLNVSGERIRKVDPQGMVTSVAGAIDPPDTGPQALAKLALPRALVVGSSFSLIASGASGVVEALRGDRATIAAQEGILNVVAGRYPGAQLPTGNLARFRSESFGAVNGVAYDEAGQEIYLSETGTDNHRIHRVKVVDVDDEHTWTIETLAGTTAGFADGIGAQFREPSGLFLDSASNSLWVADTGNHAIRRIDLASDAVATIVGVPEEAGNDPLNGSSATEATLNRPVAITGCPNGDIYIADTGNNRVLRLEIAGCDLATPASCLVTEVLGDEAAVSSGEGSPSNIFPVKEPLGLHCDSENNLFVTSSTTVRLLTSHNHDGNLDTPRVVDGQGDVQSIISASASAFSCLSAIAGIDDDTVWITDTCTGSLLELSRPLPVSSCSQ